MEHLEEARLMAHVWDGAVLGDDERVHLDDCDVCRTQLSALRSLTHELNVAQASTARPEVESRYVALFARAQADGRGSSLLARATQWLQAQLTFDSRTQALVGGVRSGLGSSYRLLFATDGVEIELMVESMQGQRRMVGEVVSAGGEPPAAALVALMLRDGTPVSEAESDEFGRFMFQGIDPGEFALVVTPSAEVADGPHTIEIGALVIT